MISVVPELQSIVKAGALVLDGVRNAEADARLDPLLADAERRVREAPPEERTAVRAMYRAVGLDPTRRRPSSEALLRRVCRGEGLPRINTLVDIGNWCSLEFQLPYGLYDLAHVQGEISLRLGLPGEAYAGIRKDEVHVGGRLTLADSLGAFGNPSADSSRTMVTAATERVLVVVYAPADLPRERLEDVLARTAERMLRLAGGRETSRAVI